MWVDLSLQFSKGVSLAIDDWSWSKIQIRAKPWKSLHYGALSMCTHAGRQGRSVPMKGVTRKAPHVSCVLLTEGTESVLCWARTELSHLISTSTPLCPRCRGSMDCEISQRSHTREVTIMDTPVGAEPHRRLGRCYDLQTFKNYTIEIICNERVKNKPCIHWEFFP